MLEIDPRGRDMDRSCPDLETPIEHSEVVGDGGVMDSDVADDTDLVCGVARVEDAEAVVGDSWGGSVS